MPPFKQAVSMRTMRHQLIAVALIVAGVVGFSSVVHAQSATETILYSFGGDPDGNGPYGSLIQASDGNFYGMTVQGGSAGAGTIFKITPSGTETILHSFGDGSVVNDGASPYGNSLIQATDGNFYGMTPAGGSSGAGTIFKITPSGNVTILHSFADGTVLNDGSYPLGSLIQAADGNFYGMTSGGGSAGSTGAPSGTVFKITPSGTVAILHSFADGSVVNDGNYPKGNLIQATDGNFYGMTQGGGSDNGGSVFKMTPSGSETILYSFLVSVNNDGWNPVGSLAQGIDGNFYGTTYWGGFGPGTIFKITPSGTETILHSFGDGSVPSDGLNPAGSLIQGTDGNFYGLTSGYGDNSWGNDHGDTVFKITPSGVETILHSFGDGSVPNDGGNPQGSLIEGEDRNFYGMTFWGGSVGVGLGTVFKLTPLSITSLSPSSAIVGPQPIITITGTGFVSGCTVLVNGTSYNTKYNSSTSLTFTMPSSKMTKTHVLSVQVQNPSPIASSNALPFTVFDNPPTTTAALSGTEVSGAYVGEATITLTAVRGTAAVADTYYTIDGGATQTYTTPFSVSTLGSDTVTYWSVDTLGGIEAAQPTSFTVGAPPIASLSPNSGLINTQPKITIAGTGFAPGSTIVVNGDSYIATYISPTALTFIMPSSKMNKTHVLSVQVQNPSSGGISGTLPFTVTDVPPVHSVQFSPASLCGGLSTTGTVTLTAAPAADLTITVTPSDSNATIVGPVVVPAGQKSTTFTVNTSVVTATDKNTITVQGGGTTTASAYILIEPIYAVYSLHISPTSVVGGTSTTGTVTLTAPAAADQPVSVTTSDGNASIVGTVIVPAGQKSLAFTIDTTAVSADDKEWIYASADNTTKSAYFIIAP